MLSSEQVNTPVSSKPEATELFIQEYKKQQAENRRNIWVMSTFLAGSIAFGCIVSVFSENQLKLFNGLSVSSITYLISATIYSKTQYKEDMKK